MCHPWRSAATVISPLVVPAEVHLFWASSRFHRLTHSDSSTNYGGAVGLRLFYRVLRVKPRSTVCLSGNAHLRRNCPGRRWVAEPPPGVGDGRPAAGSLRTLPLFHLRRLQLCWRTEDRTTSGLSAPQLLRQSCTEETCMARRRVTARFHAAYAWAVGLQLQAQKAGSSQTAPPESTRACPLRPGIASPSLGHGILGSSLPGPSRRLHPSSRFLNKDGREESPAPGPPIPVHSSRRMTDGRIHPAGGEQRCSRGGGKKRGGGVQASATPTSTTIPPPFCPSKQAPKMVLFSVCLTTHIDITYMPLAPPPLPQLSQKPPVVPRHDASP